MTRAEGPSHPLRERRIPLRAGTVVAVYLLYLWLEDRLTTTGGLLVGAGVVFLAWAAIDRLTLEPVGPMPRKVVAQAGIGVALAAAGVVTAVGA